MFGEKSVLLVFVLDVGFRFWKQGSRVPDSDRPVSPARSKPISVNVDAVNRGLLQSTIRGTSVQQEQRLICLAVFRLFAILVAARSIGVGMNDP